MNQKDVMKDWFKELPHEQPSTEFTVRVMQRVMTEWTLNPYKYQPIITKKGWWTIGLFAFLFTGFLFMLHSFMPGSGQSVSTPSTLYGLDITRILGPFAQVMGKLTNLSPAIVVGTFAIIALWFFDQLFNKALKH